MNKYVYVYFCSIKYPSDSRMHNTKYVLGIDPGSAKLGMSCVKWNGQDCMNEKNFSLEWMCLIHLTNSFKGPETNDLSKIVNHRTEIIKYEEMHCQIERLYAFLDTNENFGAVLKLPGLRVCIEQQEGARDINVLFRLMRINFLSGFICGYLKRKRIPFTFVPKTYKCGWSFMGTLAKKKLERVSFPLLKNTKGKNKREGGRRRMGYTSKSLTPERKRALMKQYKKEAVCAFVRRVIEMGSSSEELKIVSKRVNDVDFNHMADSASQTIRYIKEMELSGCYHNICTDDENGENKNMDVSFLKKIKDTISMEMKKHLSDTF